jgi:hypothetical protein
MSALNPDRGVRINKTRSSLPLMSVAGLPLTAAIIHEESDVSPKHSDQLSIEHRTSLLPGDSAGSDPVHSPPKFLTLNPELRPPYEVASPFLKLVPKWGLQYKEPRGVKRKRNDDPGTDGSAHSKRTRVSLPPPFKRSSPSDQRRKSGHHPSEPEPVPKQGEIERQPSLEHDPEAQNQGQDDVVEIPIEELGPWYPNWWVTEEIKDSDFYNCRM